MIWPLAISPAILVMPMGDSITSGWPTANYRSVVAKIPGVNLVGSMGGHEGHPGWTIADLAKHKYQPADFTLLQAGTNDMWKGKRMACAALQDLRILLRQLKGKVLVTGIPPSFRLPLWEIEAFNAKVPDVAREYGAIYVGPNPLSFGDMRQDLVHPTPLGQVKLGEFWASHLRPLLLSSKPRTHSMAMALTLLNQPSH